jgi:hypothetical protein
VVVTVLLPLLVFFYYCWLVHRLYNACQGIPTKISLLIHCFLLIILVKALLLTGILSCIFPFSGAFEYIIIYFICQYKSESSHDLHQFVNGLYNWTEFAFSKSKYCFNHCVFSSEWFVASSRLEMKAIPIQILGLFWARYHSCLFFGYKI